jgi:ubiquinone/menaquinone biosynthesis C-methylase UbiE
MVDPHAAAYDQLAARFERLNAEMPQSLVLLGSRLLAQVGRAPQILDVGCGPGRDMAWFEARGASTTGIDVSTEMLARAASRASGHLAQMDMRRLKFPDASFDAVWVIASLLHIPKVEAPQALSELRRVVRERGFVAVGVKRGAGEAWQDVSDGARRLFAYYEPDELTGLLAQANLEADSVHRSPGHGCEWLTTLARAR